MQAMRIGLLSLAMTACSQLAFGQSGRQPLSQADVELFHELQWMLICFLMVILVGGTFWLRSIYNQRKMLVPVQLHSWMARQANVLITSIGVNTREILKFWLRNTELELIGALEGTHAVLNERNLQRQLMRVRLSLQWVTSTRAGRYFMLFDLPAPASARTFQVFLTPWGYLRHRIGLMMRGALKDYIVCKNGEIVYLGEGECEEVKRLFRKLQASKKIRRHFRRFHPLIQRIHGFEGTPEEFVATLIEAWMALVIDRRAPKGAAQYESIAHRRQDQEAFIKELLDQLFSESATSGAVNTPWARVCAAAGHWLALFEQIRELKRDNDNPNLRLWEMRFSTFRQNQRAWFYAEQLFELCYTESGKQAVIELAVMLAPFFGMFDSLIWYRGPDNWKQMANPVMQEQPASVVADEYIANGAYAAADQAFLAGRAAPPGANWGGIREVEELITRNSKDGGHGIVGISRPPSLSDLWLGNNPRDSETYVPPERMEAVRAGGPRNVAKSGFPLFGARRAEGAHRRG